MTATPTSSLYTAPSASISVTIGAIAPPTAFVAVPSEGFVGGGTELTIKGSSMASTARVEAGIAGGIGNRFRQFAVVGRRARARPPDD